LKSIDKAAVSPAPQTVPRGAARAAQPADTVASPRSGGGRRIRPSVAWLPPLAYLAAALVLTWPWVAKPTTTLIAPLGGDVSTSVSKFSALLDSGVIPFFSDRLTSVAFPIGIPTTPGVDAAAAFSTLYLWIGSAVMGPVAAHGLMGVLGIFLTATVTYLFVKRVTGSMGAGLVAGVAYGFAPHLILMSWAATTYSHMWLLLLPIWGFWNLAQEPRRRTALLAGASLVPAIFWTPYFALHASVVGVACFAVIAALGTRLGVTLRMLGLATVPWAAAYVVYLAIGVGSSFSDAPDRPLTDFYEQAAHPLMFLWPGFASIWGDGVHEALVDLVPRAHNANIYVGLSVVALGAVGVWATMRHWVRRRLAGRPSPQAVAAALALAVVVASLLCSLPPRVLNSAVPMPGSLVFEVAPGLRAGQRFVMPLMAGTAVLAGLGASAMLGRVRPRAVLPLALVLALVVGVDLYTRPPLRTSEIPPSSPALEALARAPDGPVVHIQPQGFLGGVPQRACLMQMVHHKTVVNACGFTTPGPLIQVGKSPMCRALRTLRRSGVRYVLTEPLPPPANVRACFERSRVGPWRTLAHDDLVWIFEMPPSRS
jgi:hypothetical protein